MLIKEMTVKECRETLARTGFGRLGCARDNQPYVVPIYFIYEPDHLYGFSTLGRKIEWMRSNPKVCVEVDDVTSQHLWLSVVVIGRYEELPDVAERSSERRHAQMLLEKRLLWWQIGYAAKRLRPGKERTQPILYCIHIEEVTGHRATPDAVESAIGPAKLGGT